MPMRYSWDIFCRVVDNYGDVGVCWRLACQLRRGQAAAVVRLWVDDLERLHRLVPECDARLGCQTVAGIEVRELLDNSASSVPADIVIEAFGCGLPEPYVAAMVERTPRPLWITLEYLSAEPWVREHHGLPSPHPRSPLERYFFFPGFERGTGGLLREPDLLQRRDQHGSTQRERLWHALGYAAPEVDATVVSIFGYPDAPLVDLLAHWEHGTHRTVAAISESELAARALAFMDAPSALTPLRRGNLELRIVPFVPQPQYDELLWSCDYAFVRGEDSFVRAQWAARPFIWNIYPQGEAAHRIKLEAFMDLYCAGWPAAIASDFRDMWLAWNQMAAGRVTIGAAWDRWSSHQEWLVRRAGQWCVRLLDAGELAESLAHFCSDKLK
ncbi:MAG TPA: elongation factor P maturation arginine rhamnosyltransferase EarP [Burkholderiales bacterium]|nr:elongation factor P maturation arginine rhamnosyltransferase EarP [Burkholderiales bacterium]